MAHINMKGAIKRGWQQAMKNFVVLFFSAAIFVFFHAVMAVILQMFKGNEAVYHLLAVLFSLMRAFFIVGVIRLWLAAADGEKPSIGFLFSGGDAWITYFFAELLYFLLVIVGTCLFVVPGIIWAIQFQFVTYIVADKNVSVVNAFKESARLTKGRKMDLCVFGAVLSLINFAGLLCFGIGLLLALICTAVAYASMYRSLSQQQEEQSYI